MKPKSFIEEVSQRKLIFVTGKGGIGKTIVAASLAKMMAQRGKRVLLVQQSAMDHVAPLFGVAAVGHEERWIAEGLGLANFTAAGNFRDFVSKHLKHGAFLDVLAKNKVVHGFFTAIPGFGELMFLGRIFYALNLASEPRPDLVIVDGFASGHFMSLMTTPDAVLDSGLAGPIMTETKRVKEFLASPACGILVVGVPEELVVTEMLDFIPRLTKKSPTPVIGVVFNRSLLAQESSKMVQGNVANDFLRRARLRQEAALRYWQTAKSELPSIPEWKLPELGFIDEPLTAEFVEAYLGSVNAGGAV